MFNSLLFALVLSISGTATMITAAQSATTSPEPIVLWPNGAPGATGNEPLDIPTLTPFLPSLESRTGAAVIVCPGGGYGRLADHEGRPVAEWLSGLGVAAFVLKYRHTAR